MSLISDCELSPDERRAVAFIKDLIALERKHNLVISHEDEHGDFIIEEFSQHRVDWLVNARLAVNIGYGRSLWHCGVHNEEQFTALLDSIESSNERVE